MKYYDLFWKNGNIGTISGISFSEACKKADLYFKDMDSLKKMEEHNEDLKTFELFWGSGVSEIIRGRSEDDAWLRSGYPEQSARHIKYWKELYN